MATGIIVPKRREARSVRYLGDGTIDIWSLTEDQFRLFKEFMKNRMESGEEITPKDQKMWAAILERDGVRSGEAKENGRKLKKANEEQKELDKVVHETLGQAIDQYKSAIKNLGEKITSAGATASPKSAKAIS